MATKQPVQIADVQDEPHYSDAPSPSCPPRRSRQKLAVSSTGGESYPLCKMARNRVFPMARSCALPRIRRFYLREPGAHATNPGETRGSPVKRPPLEARGGELPYV
jgi:hypothetical protein